MADETPNPAPVQPQVRRSRRWTGETGINGFLQRSSLREQGLRPPDYDRPIIGICTNTSDFNRCHMHFDGMVNGIKEAVLQSGALPRVFITMTMGTS